MDGYSFDPSVRENNVGFYPLYPIATRLLSRALRAPLLPTGIALSLACLGGALRRDEADLLWGPSRR